MHSFSLRKKNPHTIKYIFVMPLFALFKLQLKFLPYSKPQCYTFIKEANCIKNLFETDLEIYVILYISHIRCFYLITKIMLGFCCLYSGEKHRRNKTPVSKLLSRDGCNLRCPKKLPKLNLELTFTFSFEFFLQTVK